MADKKAKVEACSHDQVSRADYVHGRPFWKCDRCNAEFMEAAVMLPYLDERIDFVVQTTSAMLWDFHQRAVEEYGQNVATAVQAQAEPTCEDDAHSFANGVCTGCGISQFLGG